MPTFHDPVTDAAEAQQALHSLAHATRDIEDPTQIYPVLGSLSAVAGSLGQSLHQLAAFHDRPAQQPASVDREDPMGRAAEHQVSWGLHRAGEILRQVSAALDHAHKIEALISYDRRDAPFVPEPPHSTPNQGLSL